MTAMMMLFSTMCALVLCCSAAAVDANRLNAALEAVLGHLRPPPQPLGSNSSTIRQTCAGRVLWCVPLFVHLACTSLLISVNMCHYVLSEQTTPMIHADNVLFMDGDLHVNNLSPEVTKLQHIFL